MSGIEKAIDVANRIVDFIIQPMFDRLRLSFNSHRYAKLVSSTPLIEGYEVTELSPTDLKEVHAKYKRCRTLGHLWELDHVIAGFPYTYVVNCARCFPHIRSRRTVESYNLFAITDKEQD